MTRAATFAVFLDDAARYFENRPTGGEDMAHWANVYNAQNCREAAQLLRDSDRHAQRGDPSGAPSEGCQSGGAEGDASPNPSINQETPHAR